MAEYDQNNTAFSRGGDGDGEELFQVVKKRTAAIIDDEPDSGSAAAPASAVYSDGEEEFIQVVKSPKSTVSPAKPATATPSAVQTAGHISAVVAAPGGDSSATDFFDLDDDGDVDLRVKRRVVSPTIAAESLAAQRLNRRPVMPSATDELMKPKNYFFGCFSFVLISVGLILGCVWFCSKNWKAIRQSLGEFDQWMVDNNLAKRPPEKSEHEKVQDEIRAELMRDNIGSEEENIPKIKSGKDAARHFRNYAKMCEMADQ